MNTSTASRAATGIQSCPFEILVSIFLLLPASSKLALRSSCQFLAGVFESSSSIKYHLKLGIWGMSGSSPDLNLLRLLGRDPTLPYVERLRRLDSHIHNFSTLQWLKSEAGYAEDLLHSILSGDYLFSLSAGEQSSLQIHALPNAIRGTTTIRRVASNDLPFAARSMAIDCSQNLVIIFESYVLHHHDCPSPR